MPTGEFDLIDRYFSSLTKTDSSLVLGPGDDAAIIQVPAEKEVLLAVDTLVKDVHFFSDVNPHDLGYKCLAVNVSDIAAMGGVPRWATLSLTLENNDELWLSEFAAGFASLANDLGIQLVGGDTTRGPLTISVQLSGLVDKGRALKRSGAQAGDLIFVSGYPGLAAYALSCLKRNEELPGDSLAMQRLQRPTPREGLGQALTEIASAAIDISDGLSADLGHILRASGVAADIRLEELPSTEELSSISSDAERFELILAGGDDYELCFTVPIANKEKLEQTVSSLD